MQIAIVNDTRAKPSPGEHGLCPACKTEVLAKCGSINVWHWAHKICDCDPWSEPETQWHINWKNKFPEQCREVVIGNHRADVKIPKGTVIEFQRSPIDAREIIARELHYQDMVWVLHAADFWDNFDTTNRGNYYSFQWKHPRKCWWASNKPILLDFEDGMLFFIKKIHKKTPCRGWGEWIEASKLYKEQK